MRSLVLALFLMVPVLAAAQGPSCTSAPPVVFVQTGPTTYTTERDVAAKRNGDCIGVATYVRTSDGFLRFQVQWAPCVGTTWRLGIDHGTMSAALRAAGIAPTCPVVPPVVVPPVVPPISPATKWVMGYYVGYQRNLYPESQIDFSLLTHIAVGAIEPNGVGGVLTDFFVNAVDGPVMARTIAQRAHAAGKKAILMLGGSGYNTQLASSMSGANRATFINNLVATVNSLGYDGIDVDWEPISVADQPMVLDLLQSLRAAKPNIILTMPVAWHGPLTTWYGQVATIVDQMNVMSYDMAGNWGGWDSWHSSALFGETATHPTSVSAAVKLYQNVGVPNAKIGVGIGFYGSCWSGVSVMGVPLGSGQNIVAGDNTMSYVNIMTKYYSTSTFKWDLVAKAGYLSFPTAAGSPACNMVSYESPESVAEKGAYVRSANLGGTIIWTINQGYFPTAALGARDPLLLATYRALNP